MIIATAGHVDHGKTSLIKQLTGTDTDRLEEEKRRGLSIDLGFAYRQTGNASLGFIDVPGHKRFINTMISGISGIDMGLLIVAADDGPMPQTLEHLEVLLILGITKITIVISKIDKADSARIQTVKASVLNKLPDELKDKTEVFELSNNTGEGVKKLQDFLDLRAKKHRDKSSIGLFRQAIDRVFTLKGTGIVTTGTVSTGEINLGDSVELHPSRTTLRVRGIHAHDQAAETAKAGQRCAINLSGDIHKENIHKGDWLLETGSAEARDCFSARFRLLSSSPIVLKHMSPVKLHIGARHLSAKISFLEDRQTHKKMHAGDERLVRFLLNEPVCCCCTEHYLIRDDSESFTLGGGIVLDPFASRKRKITTQYLNFLGAMSKPDFVSSFNELIFNQQQIIDFKNFRLGWNLSETEAQKMLSAETLPGEYFTLEADGGRYCLSDKLFLELTTIIFNTVQNWHKTKPNEKGIPKEKLHKLTKEIMFKEKYLDRQIEEQVYSGILKALINKKQLQQRDGLIKQIDFSPISSSLEKKEWILIENALLERGKKIPSLAELIEITQLDNKKLNFMLNAAIKNNKLKKINNKRFALNSTLLGFGAETLSIAQDSKKFTAVDFKNKIGIGSNLAIEILEYFDSIRFTQRQGNERIILDENIPDKLFQR